MFSVESDAWTTTYPQIFTHSNWRFTTGKAGIQCSLVTPHVNSSCSVLGRKSDDEVFVMDNSNIDNSDITPDDNLVTMASSDDNIDIDTSARQHVTSKSAVVDIQIYTDNNKSYIKKLNKLCPKYLSFPAQIKM